MRKALVLLATLGSLTACSSGSSEEPADDTTAAAPSTGSETADVTAAVTGSSPDPWTLLVTKATQTQPGRVEVETTVTDPRGAAGSIEAQQAIDVCEGVVAWLTANGTTDPKVSVFEADGTTFVLAGHPTYGPSCTEV